MNQYNVISVDSTGEIYNDHIESDIDVSTFLKEGTSLPSDECYPDRVVQRVDRIL